MTLTSWLKKKKQRSPAPFQVTMSVLTEIRNTIGSLPAEHGGVLGAHPEEGVVTEFYFDRAARRNTVTYTPDDSLLNRLFAEDWNPRGIRVMGFVHSHPGIRIPSQADISYSQRILNAIPDLERLLIPIVLSGADGDGFEILPYAVVRQNGGVDVTPLKMIVIDDQGRCIDDWAHEIKPCPIDEVGIESAPVDDTASRAVENGPGQFVTAPTPPGEPLVTDSGTVVPEAFQRVAHAYDLDLMKRSRIIYVGAGGAAGFIEDLVRAGVGEHVLIDPDTVSETNLSTQQTYRRDIDRPKVDAIADRIRDINPDALVIPLKMSLDDIDDRVFEFYALAGTVQQGTSHSLICGLTDNFYAQARVNRLALTLGLPSLCAQVYREGRGAEVTFTHPDVTAACSRCALGSRYRAYLDGGYQNTVTSDGTPIFATARLNALKGFVAMALLHHGSSDQRWGHLLKKIGNRNLIQVRMDPDLSTTLGLRVFDRVFENADGNRILFDETVWLPQEPELASSAGPACPDCSGTGNLRDSIGTITDTRTIRN